MANLVILLNLNSKGYEKETSNTDVLSWNCSNICTS